MTTQLSALRRNLLNWFRQNKRELPWRQKRHWYTTWLSEVILQQTTVEQGLPYYHAFVERFPNVHTLAEAEEQEILHQWQGLGYYARARNLHKAARQIARQHHGRFPNDKKLALALPGIGPYTAAAILSLSYNRPYAVVDGNVTRVISRLQAIAEDIRLRSTQKIIEQHAQTLLSKKYPGAFNEAMMELGALVCTPVAPRCPVCPLSRWCLAYRQQKTDALPFKSAPPPKKRQYHWVVVYENTHRYLIRQRPEKGLLARMWEFPVWETDARQLKNTDSLSVRLSGHRISRVSGLMRHVYSHINLQYRAVLVEGSPEETPGTGTRKWVKKEEFNNYPIHKAHRHIINWLLNDQKGR